jgi:bacillithiol system protein YtxJ
MSAKVESMSTHFVKVDDTKELEDLSSLSYSKPVILFKHSLTCPLSATAYREMEQLDDEVHLVVVQRAPAVSREVESKTGVRHESPQVIVLRNGKAVWTTSHWNVKADAVAATVKEQS